MRSLEQLEADIDRAATLCAHAEAEPENLRYRSLLLEVLAKRPSPFQPARGYGDRLNICLAGAMATAHAVVQLAIGGPALRTAVHALKCELIETMGEIERLKGK